MNLWSFYGTIVKAFYNSLLYCYWTNYFLIYSHSQTITAGSFIKYGSSLAYVSCGIKHHFQSKIFLFLLVQPWEQNDLDQATTLSYYHPSESWLLLGLQDKIEQAFMVDMCNSFGQLSTSTTDGLDLVYCPWDIDFM